jgi:hypothetical protein
MESLKAAQTNRRLNTTASSDRACTRSWEKQNRILGNLWGATQQQFCAKIAN